ncbi:hypothetical protein [Cupriavidus oxalaticus]|uniref:hypothetical protein n=1 Tax=Cupriavidus oxalaticus TaxID=96344 RepID=UPI003F740082
MNQYDRLAGANVMEIGLDTAGQHHAADFCVCIRHLYRTPVAYEPVAGATLRAAADRRDVIGNVMGMSSSWSLGLRLPLPWRVMAEPLQKVCQQ